MIVVTGGSGFIGRAVVAEIHRRGLPATNVDVAQPREPSAAEWLRLDIRDPALAEALGRVRPHAVIHLAARPTVTAYGPGAIEAESINVGGTVRVLEACRQAGVPRFVLASSAAVYGDAGAEPLPEARPPAPRSAYGASKVAAEAYAWAYARSAGLGVVVLRPATVYGPWQRPTLEGAACAAFADALAGGRQGTIFGDGEQSRDYVYVDDVARAFVDAATTVAAQSGTYNAGSGRSVTIRALYAAIAQAAGQEDAPAFGPQRPGDIRHSVLDPSRAARELGWRAETALGEGLARTVAWARGR